MKVNYAYTCPINSPFVSPTLTQSQIWQGLVEKCRKPQDFVPDIADCEVIEESHDGLKRIVTFKPGMGLPAGKVTEVVTYHGQTTVRVAPTSLAHSHTTLTIAG